MSAITDIAAREILDSRGNPAVEVDVVLESGAAGQTVPLLPIQDRLRASAERLEAKNCGSKGDTAFEVVFGDGPARSRVIS